MASPQSSQHKTRFLSRVEVPKGISQQMQSDSTAAVKKPKASRERPPSRKAAKIKVRSSFNRPAAAVWAVIAGTAMAGALSASLSDQGRDRLAAAFGLEPSAQAVIAEAPAPRDAYPDSPMVTGSINEEVRDQAENAPTPLPTNLTALSVEVAQLRTANRRLIIERDRLAAELAALKGEAAPIANPTGSLPGANRPGALPGDARAPQRQPARVLSFDRPPEDAPPARVRVRTMSLPQSGSVPVSGLADEQAIAAALERALEADAPDALQVTQTAFAIQIASARTMDEARSRWREFAEVHSNLVSGLRPAVHVQETAEGLRFQIMAGPLRNAADAVQICARLIDRGSLCQAVPFNGQHLAMR